MLAVNAHIAYVARALKFNVSMDELYGHMNMTTVHVFLFSFPFLSLIPFLSLSLFLFPFHHY